MAGLLALGAAACGDDVEIVQPTPEPPPPPPPVTATMAPASASVAVGNSVVFAVNASGGVAGDAASWTCASSNTGIATVSSTSAGCSATGVAAGDVTITASVSKSGETVNVGAQLTVTSDEEPPAPPGDPAFLIVANITDNTPDDGTLSGRVTATVNVERGDQTLHALSLLVDGTAVASQSFGGGMDMGMAPEAEDGDAAAEQAVHAFTLSFNTAGYDDHGHVDYMNGDHTIAAELQIAGGMMSDGMMGYETISSNVQTVEFANEDGYIVTADLGHNSMLDSRGRRWYGGPANGHIVISALAVSYSGEETGAVKISLGDCEAEEGDGDDDGDDHGGPGVSVEFDCAKKSGTQAITVSAGGEDRTILNEEDLPDANIDMLGPPNPPIIVANRNDRENGWINSAVGISGRFNKTSAKDNWLVRGDLASDTLGVGGYNMGVRIGADLKKALAAAAASSAPAESDDNDAYCAVAVAMDDLGNMATVPPDTTTCRPAPAGEDVELTINVNADGTPAADTVKVFAYDANSDDDDDPNTTPTDVSRAGQTLEFGVDTTAPVIEVDDEEETRFDELPFPDGSGLELLASDDQGDVGDSGLLTTGGILVQAQRRTATKSDCAAIQANGTVRAGADSKCNFMEITDTDVNFEDDSISVAYYTVNAKAKDQAGNTSSTVSHTLANDRTPATATAPSVPGSIAAGKTFSGATYLNDNLSIRDYYGTMDYGTGPALRLGIGAPVAVDAFNSASLTRLNHQVSQTVGIVTSATSVADPYKALQTSLGGALEALTTVSVFVRDQTQDEYGSTPGSVTGTPSATLNLTGAADTDDDFDSGAFAATDGYRLPGSWERRRLRGLRLRQVRG